MDAIDILRLSYPDASSWDIYYIQEMYRKFDIALKAMAEQSVLSMEIQGSAYFILHEYEKSA
jgi:hypothetical protein